MHRSNDPSFSRVRSVSTRKRKLSTLACALLAPTLLAAVAACSSGGSSAGSSGGSDPSSVTLSITIAAPTSAPVYIAQSLGYFKQQGLNVNVKIIPDAYESLATGQIQFGDIGVAQVVQAASSGTPLQQICVTETSPSYVMAVSQKTMSAKGITATMSLKETLTKLKGEVVTEVGGAVNPGSILLASLLKQNGLPSNWITVVSETSNASATASFIEGQAGVVFQPQPVPDALLAKVPGKIIFNTADSPLFANLDGTPWSGIAASKSYIAAHPGVSKEICNAIGKADNYIVANPAQAAKDIQPQMSSYPAQLIQEALPTYKFAAGATMSESQFDAGIKVLSSYGIFQQPSASALSSAYTTKYQS
jgi:ABC-type nitrate/sulfonate/bicarbonate transport system substrate-binding protein